jgi:hypothetical protein
LTGAKDTVTPTGGLTATSTLTDPTKVTPMGGLSTTGATTVTPTGGATTGASTLVDAGKSTVTPTGGLSTTGTLTGGQPTTSSTATPATGTRDIGAMLSANALGDNNLTYDQLLTLLRNNNITIDQAAPFLGDAATRPEIVSALKNYQKLYDERYVNTYDPRTINTYALYQAEELAREGQRVDFSNQNRATQLEAWKRGYWTPADLKPIGTYGSNDIYLTSGITSANQGITGNPLVSTLQTALQNPGGMRENVGKAVRAYQDPTGKVIASPAQIAAADAYVKKLTGDPNATYVGTLRELDTYGGGGFMYDESRLLGDVKNKLTSGLEANLSISKWDPKTRGQMFAKNINDLGVSPSFVAAALGVTENDIFKLAGGDPTLWNKLAVNELIPTRPVVEGTSYRYGNAATVSGSNANTALTASQPTASGSNASNQKYSTAIINVDQMPKYSEYGQNLYLPRDANVNGKSVFLSQNLTDKGGFYGQSLKNQVSELTRLGVKASDLTANGFPATYIKDLQAAGLK